MSDANIDPSLQAATISPTTGALSGGMYQTVSAPCGAFNYPATSSSMNGMGGMNGAAATVDGQFQIPPELLEGWPWPFDASNGGGGGGSASSGGY